MVQSCTTYDCMNRKQKGWDILFFNFPLQNPDHLQKWVESNVKNGLVSKQPKFDM